MSKIFFIIPLLIIISASVGCSDARNFKEAAVQKIDGKICIKLFGKRKLMAHSPKDLVSDNIYTDSLLIYIPGLKNGEIKGVEIPVDKGNYKFQGSVFVNDNRLIVKIFIVNTNEKTLIPSDWNGSYVLPN